MEFENMVAVLFKQTGFDPSRERLLHAAVGVAGEAGEILEVAKKTWANGKSLNINHLIEELGDLEFYLEALRQSAGISRAETLAGNMSKLRARYPEGYSDAAALARADKVAK